MAGLWTILPFVDRVAYKHSLKEVPLDIEPQVCITHDNTQVQIDGILYFQVTDAKLASYGTSNYEFAIVQLAKTTLRSEVGEWYLDKLLEERATINVSVVAALDEASMGWGVKVLRYEVKDITPPATFGRCSSRSRQSAKSGRSSHVRKGSDRSKSTWPRDTSRRRSRNRKAPRRQSSTRHRGTRRASSSSRTQRRRRFGGSPRQLPGKAESKDELRVADKYVAAFANVARTSTTVVVPAIWQHGPLRHVGHVGSPARARPGGAPPA